jgi:transposase-like protein
MKNGASAVGLQRILGLASYTTAWTWLHKIRTAMVNPKRLKLSGTVEVDETYIGGEAEGKRGRGAENKTLVAVAVEIHEGRNKMGRVRLQVVPDASYESLGSFVKANAEQGSTIITDGWSGYTPLVNDGYQHRIAAKFDEVNSEGEILPHVHLIVSLLKRWLLGTHQGAVREMHLQAFLDEYVFRFNRRKAYDRGLLFYRLLEGAMQTPPTTQDEFLGHESCTTLMK